jgi:hypothetical protein
VVVEKADVALCSAVEFENGFDAESLAEAVPNVSAQSVTCTVNRKQASNQLMT